MVTLIEGLLKEVLPTVSAEPPEAAAYQSTVSPAPGVAAMVTIPVPHLALPKPDGDEGTVFTVAITAVRVADIHPVVVFLDWA